MCDLSERVCDPRRLLLARFVVLYRLSLAPASPKTHVITCSGPTIGQKLYHLLTNHSIHDIFFNWSRTKRNAIEARLGAFYRAQHEFHVFPRFWCFFFWLVHCVICICCDWPDVITLVLNCFTPLIRKPHNFLTLKDEYWIDFLSRHDLPIWNCYSKLYTS